MKNGLVWMFIYFVLVALTLGVIIPIIKFD